MIYHVITYHPFENGFDEKKDQSSLALAKKYAKDLLFTDNPGFKWYEKVFITTDKTIVCVFDEYFRNGRKPYTIEFRYFNFG